VRVPVTGETRLVGLLGWPVAHSKSPLFQNAAFAALGLDWLYVPLPTPPARLAEAVRGLAALGFAGANVTIPYKEAVLPLLDRLDPEAELSGAVNTIVVEELGDRACLVGHATDGAGFVASLREATGRDPAGMTVLLLGAGGAARAVAAALARAGAARLLIANRTAGRALALAQTLTARLGSAASIRAPRIEGLPLDRAALAPYLPIVDLVVQATAVGMAGGPDPSGAPPLDVARLRPEAVVADLVYAPRVTPFLAAAAAAGRPTLGGVGMLLHQGAVAFEHWTGQAAPLEAMRAALDSAFGSAAEALPAGRGPGPDATRGPRGAQG
jgi:shikimate dehydrogenase